MSDRSANAMQRPASVQVMPLDPAAVDALCRLAESLGLATARVDLAGCAGKDALLARIAVALDLPEWFGANWDALYDCLAERASASDPGRLLVFENAGRLRREDAESFAALTAILIDVADEWQRRGAAFRAFVDA